MKKNLDPRVALLTLACVASADAARAQACNSLYAAYVRDVANLGSCDDSSAGGVYGGAVQRLCQAGESPNDCSDRLYGVKQMGLWQPPSLPVRSGTGAFELKFLPACRDGTNSCTGREVRCHDGTRPAVMIDGARDLDLQNNVIDATSDTWVFHMSGVGQPCDSLGQHSSSCWEKYANPRIKSEHRRALSISHPDFPPPPDKEGAGGILNKDRVSDGFASFNRIKFKRCSMGSSLDYVETDTTGPEPTDIYHYGLNTWLALFHYLTTPDGRDLTLGPDLNSLANADTIVLSAASDATLWLIGVADKLSAELATIAPGATVHIVLDGYFEPMLQNEARYNNNPFAGGNIFTSATFGNPNGQTLPPPLSELTSDLGYGEATFLPGGKLRTQWENRGVFLDESCRTAHLADISPCYDSKHVLVDHVTTPWFVISDLRDPAVRSLPDFATAEYGPHRYQWHQWRFARRARDQARDIRDFWCSDSEEAPQQVNCQPPGLYLMLPPRPQHTQIANNDRFFGQNGKPRMNHCTGGVKNYHLSIAGALLDWINGQTITAIEGPHVVPGDHWVTSNDTFPNNCASISVPALGATESPSAGQCGDAIDNDHDGETDADDPSCPAALEGVEVIGLDVTGVAGQLGAGMACVFSLRVDPPGPLPVVDLWERAVFPTFEIDSPPSSVPTAQQLYLEISGANCSFGNPFSLTVHFTEWESPTVEFPAGAYPPPPQTRYYFATDGRIYLDPGLTNLYYAPPF